MQLPILPNVKSELFQMLGAVRPHIKDYLVSAVAAVFQNIHSAEDRSSVEYASQFMFTLMAEKCGQRTELENLLVLQGSIFVALAKLSLLVSLG